MRQYDAIEKQIIKILKTIPKESSRLKWSGARPWTRQIKNKICKLGEKDRYCYVCASGDNTDWEEWLYDVTWLKLDRNKSIRYSSLVLECEWGNAYEEIYNDFAKLLLARAQHRIMIFEGKSKDDILNIMRKLKKETTNFRDSTPKDRYLFAGYDNSRNTFEFDLFVLP